MCDACILNHFGLTDDTPADEVPWEPMTDEMWRVHDLCAELYSLPNGIVGGAMHIVTDDQNLEDSNLNFCLKGLDEHWSVVGAWDGPRIAEITREMVALMLPLTIRQRSTALNVVYYTGLERKP